MSRSSRATGAFLLLAALVETPGAVHQLVFAERESAGNARTSRARSSSQKATTRFAGRAGNQELVS